MLKIKITNDFNKGELIYNKKTQELDSKPQIRSDITLLLKYINLDFSSDTMEATQVWGYHNQLTWKYKKMNIPKYIQGKLILNIPLEPGISIRIKEADNWKTYYDENTGWLCVGNIKTQENEMNIEFFTNTVLTVNEIGEIKGLWLKPSFIE